MKKFKIIYKNKARKSITDYMNLYQDYYEKLFEDSGIWAEKIILEKYNFDAKVRAEEIVDLIEEKLSDDLIKYPEDLALIKWRSKYLIIKFEDKENKRIILNLDIR